VHLVFSRRIKANLDNFSSSAANRLLLSGCSSESSLTMSQELSYSDVSSHSTKKDLYVVIHDKVYNASSFVDEHP
jgi:cytochrome b involved in lipid metabolism